MNKPMTREECKIAYEEWIIEKDTDDTSSEYEKFHFYDGYNYAKKKYQQKPNTGCSNCIKIFNGSKKIITDTGEVIKELNSKIKELEETVKDRECQLCLANGRLEILWKRDKDDNTISYFHWLEKIKKCKMVSKILKQTKQSKE